MARRPSRGSTPRRGAGDWIDDLPFGTIVLHRTVGLYRNLEQTVFPERATPAGLANARARVLDALAAAGAASRRPLAVLDGSFASLLDPATGPGPAYFAGLPLPRDPKAARWDEATFADLGGGAMTAVVNAEDHLALFDRSEGPFVRQWKTLDLVADAVGKTAPFAYAPDYGHLAANPDHVGTGLVLSCDVSLFGLCIDRSLDASLRALDRLGFLTEPVYGPFPGEDSPVEAPGCLYRIVSARDTGAARDIVARMDAVCREVARQEQNARLRLLDDRSPELLDFVARSVAAGAYAHAAPASEAIDLALAAIFAADLGLLRLRKRELEPLLALPALLAAEAAAAPAAHGDAEAKDGTAAHGGAEAKDGAAADGGTEEKKSKDAPSAHGRDTDADTTERRAARAALLAPVFRPLLPQLDRLGD